VLAYLMIAVAGVTHQDLLLEKSVQLPIFGIDIPQIQFFQFAPILLVLFHLGIISQLVLLARKTLEFDLAVQQLETSVKRTHPLRLELHNFFFVQGIAGSNRSLIMGAFLHGMSWLTLVIIPVLLLLFIQIKFLPYHSVGVTWVHRLALVADVAMMVLIGVFLIRPEASFFRAVLRSMTQYPLGFVVTVSVFAIVLLFSFFIATVPGETLDRVTQRMRLNAQMTDASSGRFFADSTSTSGLAALATGPTPSDPQYMIGFAVPSFIARSDGSLFGLFHRNLIVQDTDLVANSEVTEGEPSLNLRNRDLRFARLDRSDLHQADLTGANLDGASLEGADLRRIRLQCADITTLILTEDRVRANCPSARNANFARAVLADSEMSGADLRGAKFEEAKLTSAMMAYSLISGANFTSADLRKAVLSGGVKAQGADFLIASLEGADLNGAHLQFAHFANARMQATILDHAKLHGAVLTDVDLEGADLHRAELFAANLTDARLENADLRWASVWMTDPPSLASVSSADLSLVTIAPPSEAAQVALRQRLRSIEPKATRDLVVERLRPLLDQTESKRWASSDARAKWRDLVAERTVPLSDDAYPLAVAEGLAELACRGTWPDGATATGAMKRAGSQNFRGSRNLFRERVAESTCLPMKQTDPALMKTLRSTEAG
ncbi:MAG: pentapeptide repeat-containing protein, partial [Pseudomonadota bacterium]